MPISPFLKQLRDKLGNDLIVLPSVAVAHVDDAGRILLMQFADTKQWGLPGGAVEPHEQPATAAVREMWEETGLHVRPMSIRATYGGPETFVEYPNGDQVSYLITVFDCTVIGGRLHPRDGEALDLRYFAAADLTSVDIAPWTATLLPHLLDPAAPPFFTPPDWHP